MMNPRQVTELGSSFASLIMSSQDPQYKRGVYDAAYKFAILESRKNVKFQHDFFMRYIEDRSGFKPEDTGVSHDFATNK